MHRKDEVQRKEAKLEALRVAQTELCSGDTNGSVYVQLSPGAAMFLTDRSLAVEQVSKDIRGIIAADHGDVATKGAANR